MSLSLNPHHKTSDSDTQIFPIRTPNTNKTHFQTLPNQAPTIITPKSLKKKPKSPPINPFQYNPLSIYIQIPHNAPRKPKTKNPQIRHDHLPHLPNPPPSPPPPLPTTPSSSSLLPLLLPLLLSSALSLRPFRKRKRPPFPRPNPDPSKSTFLMSSSTFHYLLGLLEPLLDCRDPPGSPLPLSPHSRLAAGLLRLASGAPYDHISRLLGVPTDAARFCARRLCRVLCTNFRFWLAFPASNADFDSVSVGFLPSLPNCCGAIVCARFEVGGGRAIAAQVVADASSKILGVATGFRGDRDDLEVLRSSSLYKGRVSAPWYLVGGGSYPLLPWLMVPFVDPRAGSSEEDFNAVHRSMCEPALRTVASLRNWGVLSRPIEEDAKMAAAFVGACSILHNVLLMREDYSALSEVGIMEDRPLNDRESGCLLEAFSEEALAIRKELTVKAKEIRGS